MDSQFDLKNFGQKIVIIGTSACGKTTLAHKLSPILGIEIVDLDDLYWLPQWKPRPSDEFIALTSKAIEKDSWIITGNYSSLGTMVWQKADSIIWLDYPIYIMLWRCLKRTITRIVTKEKVCNENYESLGRFLGKESIMLWILTSHKRRKKRYSEYFAQGENSKNLIRFHSPRDVRQFVD